MPSRLRPILPHLAAYVVFLAVALVMTYPLINHFSTRYAGHAFSDSYELARHIWWITHALQNGLPILPQPLLAYPDGLDGALLWAYPLQSFPAWLFAFVMPLPAAYNLMIVLRLALNGWAVYLLVRHLTGGMVMPALLSGAIFMAYPTFQGHLAAGHIGLLALWCFVLFAYCVIRIREAIRANLSRWGVWRYTALAALFFVMGTWGSTQLLVFTLLPFTVLFALRLLLRREWRALRHVAIAVGVGALVSLLFAVPLLRVTLDAPRPPRYHVVIYSADVLAFAAPSFEHPLFRGNALSSRILGVDPFEGAAYIGVIAFGLALVGLIRRRPARWWGVLALVAWVLSLGTLLKSYPDPITVTVGGYVSHLPMPYALVSELPLLNVTRTPGRFNFAVALAVAVMAGYGAQVIARRLRGRAGQVLIAAALMLVVYDYQFWWNNAGTLPELPTVPGVVPEPIAALRERDNLRAVLDIPFSHPLVAKQGLWLQTGHEHPLVAGHMTRQTPVSPAKLTILQETLDPALLDAAGVDVVILHKDWDDETQATEQHAREQLGEPFYEDNQYAAFYVPETDAAPDFAAIPSNASDIARRVESYVYAPEPTAVELRAVLDADGRDVVLLLDDAPVTRWTVDNMTMIEHVVNVDSGYHTLAMIVQPPCPPYIPQPLECRAVEIIDLTVESALE